MTPLRPPKVILDISSRLDEAGFETWCVGGAVRDAILGHPHLDWDLATSATPAQVRELFGHKRTIPVGIEFGTVGVLDPQGTMHEVTTFRRDVHTDGRHAVVEFGVSLDDDLARRDFTINAIAYSPKLRHLHDPFGGQEDLARRLIRAVGDANQRMAEDRLRALRAIRFAARFDFEIDAPTLLAIEASAPYLGRLSAERVKQELDKTMEQVRCPSRALIRWVDTGAFATLIPPLATLTSDDLAAVDRMAQPSGSSERRARRRVNRFAALMMPLEAGQAVRVMERLRSSKHEMTWVGAVCERWQGIRGELEDGLLAGSGSVGDGQIRRWVARIGRLRIGAVMRLASAVWSVRREAGGHAPSAGVVRSTYRRMLRAAFHDAIEAGDLAVDGDDLRRSGIPPGPGLGKILQSLLAAVLDDPTRNRTDWLLQEAKRLHSAQASAR